MKIAHTFLHFPRQCSALEHQCYIIEIAEIESIAHCGIYHIITTIPQKHIMLYVMYVHWEIFLFWFFFRPTFSRILAFTYRHYRKLCAFVMPFENQSLFASVGTCARIYWIRLPIEVNPFPTYR